MQFTLISDALMNKQAVLSVLRLPVVCADATKASLAAAQHCMYRIRIRNTLLIPGGNYRRNVHMLLTVEGMKRGYCVLFCSSLESRPVPAENTLYEQLIT